MKGCTYQYKGKWYTEQELSDLPEFSTAFYNEQLQRGFVLNNTDERTDNLINMFPASDESNLIGAFNKFIQLKKSQLLDYRRRLAKIEVERKRRDITKERLDELNKQERELKTLIDGNPVLGRDGIVDTIAELTKRADIEAVTYYVEKDLARLEKLVDSTDIDDLYEAQRLIDFYNLAGTFQRNVENPFFSQEEIFLEDEDGNLTSQYRLSDATMQAFVDWKTRALGLQNTLDKKKEETTINMINSDAGVQKTYGADRRFSFKEIIADESGLKDTDWISMWTMDITQGLFSTNGIIPQVMFSYLVNSFEKKLSWARKIEEKIDKMNPGVQKELIRLGYSLRGSGILGISGASFQIFKEITREGNETGGLVQRFVKEYYDELSRVRNKFNEQFSLAKSYDDYTVKARAFNKAFEEIKRWRRSNTIILDINRVPELMSASTPEAEAYKAELITLLGERGYKEQVDEQKKLLQKYESEKQSMIETLLINESKTTFDELSAKAKSDMSAWETNHDPKRGVDDYISVNGIYFGSNKANNYMDYNVFIPRKYQPNVRINSTTNRYEFTDTTRETKYYSSAFQQIEDNPILSEYYDTIKEVCDTIREAMPYDLQQKMNVNTIPALMKTSAEIIADKNTGILNSLFQAFRHLSERIRLGFGVIKQSEVSYAVTDPLTGRANYKVNDEFMQGNSRAVSERRLIEGYKFLQAYGGPVNRKLTRFSTFHISNLNTESLILLAQYINSDISLDDIKARRLDKVTKITGENVEVGKYIRDFALHSVVQSQSFDLSKIAKYYSNMAMSYAARQEALPILEIMKQHYESIRKPKTNNLGKGIYNVNDEEYMKEGPRTNAIKQMDDWFERVALDNYGTKHLGPHGNQKSKKRLAKIDERLAQIDLLLTNNPPTGKALDDLIAEKERLLIKRVIPQYGKTIYSNEEKKKLGEIETLLSNPDLADEQRVELIKIKEKLGKARTATAFFDNLWAWIRTLRLGYNVSSATTNFLEGVTSNMVIASSGQYFNPNEIYYAYSITKSSFLKNITFGLVQTGLAKRARKLMDKFNVIMDSKNELQKSSVKSYSSRFSWLNPHELNQRVEYINQSPLMIAILRSTPIKDKDGKESTVWDAMTNEGHLKDEFKAEDNIKNWEDFSGSEYLSFKQKLHKAIVLGHGNYDELRGMMIKSNTAGKALMMFKTWIPMQLYWRFGVEQDDIQSGTKGFKGRYWSYGKGSGSAHAGIIGLAAFGPLGALVGGGIGYFLGRQFGTDSGVGFIKELIETNKALFKKALGMPVNLLSGRKLIGEGSKSFEDWVGKGQFTEQDAKNLRGNMADLSLQLAWLGLILVTKSLFWDDDDEPTDRDRIAHNILVNKLMQLSSQAGMYVNPVDAYKSTIGSNAVIQYLTDVGKEIDKVGVYLHGNDIIQSGINAGESGLLNQTKKTFLPGIFKDSFFGFQTQAERQFEPSPYDEYFKSATKKEMESNKRDRAERRLELEDSLDYEDFEGESREEQIKARNKEIRRILDEEYPTPSKLKKLGLTRDEYEEIREEEKEEE